MSCPSRINGEKPQVGRERVDVARRERMQIADPVVAWPQSLLDGLGDDLRRGGVQDAPPVRQTADPEGAVVVATEVGRPRFVVEDGQRLCAAKFGETAIQPFGDRCGPLDQPRCDLRVAVGAKP